MNSQESYRQTISRHQIPENPISKRQQSVQPRVRTGQLSSRHQHQRPPISQLPHTEQPIDGYSVIRTNRQHQTAATPDCEKSRNQKMAVLTETTATEHASIQQFHTNSNTKADNYGSSNDRNGTDGHGSSTDHSEPNNHGSGNKACIGPRQYGNGLDTHIKDRQRRNSSRGAGHTAVADRVAVGRTAVAVSGCGCADTPAVAGVEAVAAVNGCSGRRTAVAVPMRSHRRLQWGLRNGSGVDAVQLAVLPVSAFGANRHSDASHAAAAAASGRRHRTAAAASAVQSQWRQRSPEAVQPSAAAVQPLSGPLPRRCAV